MKRKLTITIFQGLALSVILHFVLALPFVLRSFANPPEEIEPLVVELQGVTADEQTEEKLVQETKGEVKPDEKEKEEVKTAQAPTPPPSTEPQQDPTTDDKDAMPAAPDPSPPSPPPETAKPKPQTRSDNSGAVDVTGATEQQVARTVKMTPEEFDRLRIYIKGLTKKVQSHLVYPDEGRQSGLHGTATVSFAILADGRINPESLQIVASSGQPKLDESALKTIRGSAPFKQPPEAMTIAIAVAFGRKSK